MHLRFRNVTQAFREMVKGIHEKSIVTRTTRSRNGPVMVIDEPVTITYERPLERVLLNSARDANPFFHLYEALWMLAGRNDVAPLAYYASNMPSFSDDGKTFNGAYGHRWRHATVEDGNREQNPIEVDQLKILISHLKDNPQSRRAVLQMWNVEDDLLKIDGTYPCCEGVGRVEKPDGRLERGYCPLHGITIPASRDVCCNLSVTFLIRRVGTHHAPVNCDEFLCLPERNPTHYVAERQYLDMTVFNRSNDMIWGTLGANAVHFSFLQEYIARALGVEVGNYHQVSSNLHVYQNNWKPEEWLECSEVNLKGYGAACYHVPLFRQSNEVNSFDKQVQHFVEWNKNGEEVTSSASYDNDFLNDIAQPMMHAFHMHKARDYEAAYHWLSRVGQADWQRTGHDWVQIRHENWEKKHVKSE